MSTFKWLFLLFLPAAALAQQPVTESPAAVYARVHDAMITSDVSKLSNYAKFDASGDVRDTALFRLKQMPNADDLLADVARNTRYEYTRFFAASFIRSEENLRKLYYEMNDLNVRSGVASATHDTAFIRAIFFNEKSAGARMGLLRKLRLQPVLLTIAAKDEDREVRQQALARVTDSLSLVTATDDSFPGNVRYLAALRIDDQARLKRIAADTDRYMRLAAVPRISDPRFLAIVAATDKVAQVRNVAIESINDDALLRRLVGRDSAPENRVTALRNIRSTQLVDSIVKATTDTVILNFTRDNFRVTGILLGRDSLPIFPLYLGIAPMDGFRVGGLRGYGHTHRDGWFEIASSRIESRPVTAFRLVLRLANYEERATEREFNRSSTQFQVDAGRLVVPLLIRMEREVAH